MAKDRIDHYIETMKETMEKMKERPAVKEYLAMQNLLQSAERLNAAIIASEEYIPEIAAPKERKPRARKQAKMPEMNGYIRTQEVSATQTDGDRLVTEPIEGTSGN